MSSPEMQCHRFSDKTALVTGASSGIGEAVARRLFAEGASVALLARRMDRLQAVCEALDASGQRVLPLQVDVTDFASVKQAIKSTIEKFGKLDVLVNNAGQELSYPLPSIKAEHMQQLIAVNMEGVVNCCKAAYMKLSRGGAIVNMASIYGLKGAPAMSIYAMTKGGIIAFTQSLAAETARRRVRVNAVSPAMVKTELLERSLAKLSEEQVKALESQHPLGFGAPEDVAAAVAFLASDDAAWITGTNLIVDGGYVC